jgi:aldehyde dehydrogenase (NAD+)
MTSIENIVKKQREYFFSGETIPLSFRKKMLKNLSACIKKYNQEILEALHTDLNKSAFEGYVTEISIVQEEISYTLKHLSKWAKPHKVKTPITQFPAKCYQYFEPYGVTLIMAPWNYPFQLTLAPLVGAISGGNCAVLKPSNYSPATSAIIKKIVEETFDPKYVAVVEGDREANTNLLEQHFDYIFFTGGVTVGKLVMEAASKYLTPVSLELGGKSPCIIDETANIDLTAKRLAWGKFVNAGQTCVAPDYVLVHESVKEKLLESLVKWIKHFYQENPLENPNLPKIITQKHFERVSAFVDRSNSSNGKVIFGGTTNPETRQICPTILDGATPDSPVMSEEIFGPVLPILTVKNLDEVIDFVRSRPKPLALYLFTTSKAAEKRIVSTLSYGGGCINDVIVHLATSYMPFGGVGNSGMGAYHGKDSFTTFTHAKSIMNKANWLDLPVRYPPYTEKKLKLIEKIL